MAKCKTCGYSSGKKNHSCALQLKRDISKRDERIAKLEAMLMKKRDLIRCGIAANYSGSAYQNELFTEVQDLLNSQ